MYYFRKKQVFLWGVGYFCGKFDCCFSGKSVFFVGNLFLLILFWG